MLGPEAKPNTDQLAVYAALQRERVKAEGLPRRAERRSIMTLWVGGGLLFALGLSCVLASVIRNRNEWTLTFTGFFLMLGGSFCFAMIDGKLFG